MVVFTVKHFWFAEEKTLPFLIEILNIAPAKINVNLTKIKIEIEFAKDLNNVL